MKVLLVAGFLDEEVRNQGIFRNNTILPFLVRLFGLPRRVGELLDHAPWIRSTISFFENKEEIELHVAGPQIRLKRRLVEYSVRGVHYHFYRSEWSSFLRMFKWYWGWKRLQISGFYLKTIVKHIKPDIIVLSGTENPVVSVSVLSINQYPCYCLCQTIYNNPERALYAKPKRINQRTELDLFDNLRYFGVYSSLHYRLLKEKALHTTIFKFNFPLQPKCLSPIRVDKQYDFVNFALMHGPRKGTTDSIQALAYVKKHFPNVTLNIVGGCDNEVKKSLMEIIQKLNLINNVFFTSFFENNNELFLHIQKSRFAVLPCKLDHMSATMAQAMQLGLPLVVYKTTGTPTFNREKECVLIAEKGNVEELAQHMLTLLEQPKKAAQLAKNAREYQEMKAEYNKGNGDRLIANFKAIIENYHYGTPIPQNQLFNPETDD